MNRRTAIALTIGLAFVAVVAGAAVDAASDDPASDANETTTENMTESEFPWGTVTYENDSETGAVAVDVIVDAESDVSVSTMTAPNATDDYPNETTADDAEVESFPWGVVLYETDSDTGVADVELIVDADDDISVSVTSVSEDGTQMSTSTVTSTSTTESTSDGTSVSQSTSSTTSSSSVTSSSTVVTKSSNETDTESISIDIDSDTDTDDD